MAQFYRININIFKLTVLKFNYVSVSQPPDTYKKVANCVNYKIKLKQKNFNSPLKNKTFFIGARLVFYSAKKRENFRTQEAKLLQVCKQIVTNLLPSC